jgi:lactate dehydrogenase-like 2-hydroxyacid dehydrogenase
LHTVQSTERSSSENNASGDLPEGAQKVIVTRPGLPGEMLAEVARYATVVTHEEDSPPDISVLAEMAADADICLCVNGDPLNDELFSRCPSLRLVALASVGYDSVDVDAAGRRGIAVTNTPGVLDEATADLAFGLLLAARRRIVEANRYVARGDWNSTSLSLFVGRDVHSTRIGIVGYGAIGKAVARRAAGFGMEVVHHSRSVASDELSTWMPLEELLATSDVVSLHVPLTPETQGMIGAAELALMKPTATLVNTARGAVVDEAALVAALRDGRLGSAGIDVQQVEPNPDTGNPLLHLDNCVVLPHIGSATEAARAAMVDLAASNALACLTGAPLLTPVGGKEEPVTN